MRISCELEIGNRLLPSFNMKKTGKAIRAQLSVGRKPGGGGDKSASVGLSLMVCTAKDKTGTKYKLKDNVEQFFVKFMSEGKATIRLKEPQHDLILKKADPVQLKSFLSVVKLGAQGADCQKITLSSLVPAKTKQVEKPKAKLVVLSRKDYPLTTSFPSSLTNLQISTCTLKRIDTRIFQLRHLESLNLSDNSLPLLPEELGSLRHLRELNVSHNKISVISPKLWDGSFKMTLNSLDLSSNELTSLNPWFCRLSQLVNLKLDGNQLQRLPQRFGDLHRLRFFTVTNNRLSVLPASVASLRLDNIDISGNDIFTATQKLECNKGHLKESPSLLEDTARYIRRNKMEYTIEDVGAMLFELLSTVKWCLCGNPCFQSFATLISHLDLGSIANTVSMDAAGSNLAKIDGFLCSGKCVRKFYSTKSMMWK